MTVRQGYAYKILLFFDLFACAIIFRDPDVTISAEVGLAMRKPNPPWWAKALNAFLNVFEKGHCTLAIGDDIARAQNAINYLKESP